MVQAELDPTRRDTETLRIDVTTAVAITAPRESYVPRSVSPFLPCQARSDRRGTGVLHVVAREAVHSQRELRSQRQRNVGGDAWDRLLVPFSRLLPRLRITRGPD